MNAGVSGSETPGCAHFVRNSGAYAALNAEGAPPVLLIDEAETHLHYSAQADLVQVLTEQTAAGQVIYTTHSAGCLPEDLGTGVRLVVPLEGADRSTVRNSFWDEEPGFSPLLHGMGMAASAFAFTPTRFAVFAEGATEVILLPTLLREATGRRTLDFKLHLVLRSSTAKWPRTSSAKRRASSTSSTPTGQDAGFAAF